MVPPGFPGPVNPLRLRGRRAAALLSQSSYNLSHISTPSSFQPQSLVAGKRPFFPTQSCWQVQHCSHPLWTSHPDPGGGTDQDLLLLPPPKPTPPPPFPSHSIQHLSLQGHQLPAPHIFTQLPVAHTTLPTRHATLGPARKRPQHPPPAQGPCPSPAEGAPWSPPPHSPFLAITAKLQAAYPTLHAHDAGRRVTQLNVEAWASRYYKIQFTHTRAGWVPLLPQLATIAAPTFL